jgi:hypothetical protein
MPVSLDGFVETLSRLLDWVLIDQELHSLFNDQAREMAAFLYGRRLYQLTVDCWPTAEADRSATPVMLEFARIWQDKPKIVFSTTLERVEWNSRLVRDDPAAEVARHLFGGDAGYLSEVGWRPSKGDTGDLGEQLALTEGNPEHTARGGQRRVAGARTARWRSLATTLLRSPSGLVRP